MGSTDLTHYGLNYGLSKGMKKEDALNWIKEVNDKKMINKILTMQGFSIHETASENQNACGAGAIAATMGAISEAYPEFKPKLIDYKTSYDLCPEYGSQNIVGYAGILFCKKGSYD